MNQDVKTISVVLPTHNPDIKQLEEVLEGLSKQTLSGKLWELVIVDNASTELLDKRNLSLDSMTDARVVREVQLGLSFARKRGLDETRGQFVVFVDDDNILSPDYLSSVQKIFEAQPKLGACGGKSLPRFSENPPKWVENFYSCLALRDLGDEVKVTERWSELSKDERRYPSFAPIGAGMALRRTALESYLAHFNEGSVISDRSGSELHSGGDNDIVLHVLSSGYEVGYFPALELTHCIPPVRVSKDYLGRINYATSRSWIWVLQKHRILPWQAVDRWTVPLRKLRAYFRTGAWRDASAYVRWRGMCGMFDGLADI